MHVYRIAKAAYAALDGEGARINGGRWNSAGRPMLYTAGSRALATLELLVHVDPVDVPDDLVLLTIEAPDALTLATQPAGELPADWARTPTHPACVAAGDAWLAAGATVGLIVPSAPVPEERNVVWNPRHPDAALLRVVDRRPFAFDPRLVEPRAAAARGTAGVARTPRPRRRP